MKKIILFAILAFISLNTFSQTAVLKYEKNADYIILTFSHGPKLKPSFVEIKITNEGLTKLKL